MSKSIREISQMDGRVYIRFRNKDSAKRFLFQATQEGFLFTDGVKPTEKPVASVIAVNKDYTLNYVGTNGRIAYGSGAQRIGSQKLIRIEFD